ncbi:hypothetical protein HDU99_006570, partial [Rhizoclosmatium hyalinum]
YSAETIESNTKAVFNTLEPALAPLDRFACEQLDKLERNFPGVIGNATPTPTPASLAVVNSSSADPMDDARSDTSNPTTGSYSVGTSGDDRTNSQTDGSIRSGYQGDSASAFYDSRQHFDESKSEAMDPSHPQPLFQQNPSLHQTSAAADFYLPFRRHRSDSVASSISSTSSLSTMGYESVGSAPNQDYFSAQQQANGDAAAVGEDGNVSTAPKIDRKPRGVWGSMVQGVQAQVGAMVISEDAVRALKWCHKLLQEAAKNIENQVEILRRYLANYLANFRLQSLTAAAANDDPTTPRITPEPHNSADLNTAISSVTAEV